VHGVAREFRPFDIADPFALYARAREEEPVFFSAEIGFWVVTRYEDVHAIFKDPATFSSENTQAPYRQRPAAVQRVLDEGDFRAYSGLSPASRPSTPGCGGSSRRRSRRGGSRRWTRRSVRSRPR